MLTQRCTLWPALASAALLITSTPLSAAPAKPAGWDESHVKVRFGDLDLNKEKDVAKLYSRIRRAARYVCTDGVTSTRFSLWNRCYEETIADTVAQINRAPLTAFHQRLTRSRRG
jgi:UrcA family protein